MDSAKKWAKWSDRQRALKEIYKKNQKKLKPYGFCRKVGKMVRQIKGVERKSQKNSGKMKALWILPKCWQNGPIDRGR